eukprot:6176680-Pleurochrysis_carterae.AAC.1
MARMYIRSKTAYPGPKLGRQQKTSGSICTNFNAVGMFELWQMGEMRARWRGRDHALPANDATFQTKDSHCRAECECGSKALQSGASYLELKIDNGIPIQHKRRQAEFCNRRVHGREAI